MPLEKVHHQSLFDGRYVVKRNYLQRPLFMSLDSQYLMAWPLQS